MIILVYFSNVVVVDNNQTLDFFPGATDHSMKKVTNINFKSVHKWPTVINWITISTYSTKGNHLDPKYDKCTIYAFLYRVDKTFLLATSKDMNNENQLENRTKPEPYRRNNIWKWLKSLNKFRNDLDLRKMQDQNEILFKCPYSVLYYK